MSAAITLEGVGKRYRISGNDAMLAKQLINTVLRRKTGRDFWALQDIDLEVSAGESVGIVGRNGSGKTTALRLLAGVSSPTVGHLRVEGSIAPLIGVGVGFNAELTGRENVFANGQLLGLSKKQITEVYDDIVAFSELDSFVDSPVKFYSSGMFLRLAFAVAIQLEPEVLLVDEVLAVGDMSFQLKCLERIERLRRIGTTVVIVTHNLHMLGRMCDRACVLSHGRKVFEGTVEDALAEYQTVARIEDAARVKEQGMLAQQGDQALYTGGATVELDVLGYDGNVAVTAGKPFELRVRADFEEPIEDPVLGVQIGSGVYGGIYMSHTSPGEVRGHFGPDHPLDLTFRFDSPLPKGNYRAQVNVLDARGSRILASSQTFPFYVTSGARAAGVVDLAGRVEVAGTLVADFSQPSGEGAGAIEADLADELALEAATEDAPAYPLELGASEGSHD